MYRTNFEIGHSIKYLLETPQEGRLGCGHKGLMAQSMIRVNFN